MSGILLVVALVAAILAIVFFLQSRSNGEALLALRTQLEASKKGGEGEREQLKALQAELKQKNQLLVDTREKLADVRKQKQQAQPQQKQQARGAREAELEEDLRHAREVTEQAHAAESQARRDLAAARVEAEKARAELARAQERVRELANRPATAPAAPAAPPVAPDAALKERLDRALEAHKTEEKRVAELETALRASKNREQELREEIRKHKGRAETNNRVYLVTKGELEVAKERLAQAERRLWQAGITLPTSAAKERPKATGPAAAERKPEDAAAAQPAEAPVAPVAPQNPAPAIAAEVSPAVAPTEPQNGAQPTPPIVRKRREGEG